MNRADQAVSTGQNHVPFVESVSGGFLIKSVMNTRTTSEQALYRLLRLFCKSQSALMPLLLLSKSNPLCWASIWFLGEDGIIMSVMNTGTRNAP